MPQQPMRARQYGPQAAHLHTSGWTFDRIIILNGKSMKIRPSSIPTRHFGRTNYPFFRKRNQ
jgi:hypothetical protein